MSEVPERNHTQVLSSVDGQPTDGDIYDEEGNHIGSLYLEDVTKLEKTKSALSVKILYKGDLYIYKLTEVTKAEFEDDKPS